MSPPCCRHIRQKGELGWLISGQRDGRVPLPPGRGTRIRLLPFGATRVARLSGETAVSNPPSCSRSAACLPAQSGLLTHAPSLSSGHCRLDPLWWLGERLRRRPRPGRALRFHRRGLRRPLGPHVDHGRRRPAAGGAAPAGACRGLTGVALADHCGPGGKVRLQPFFTPVENALVTRPVGEDHLVALLRTQAGQHVC